MIADQALARIAACHRAGVIHRDVKPDNLLLGHPKRGKGANRAVHLVDFGLAAFGPLDGATLDNTSFPLNYQELTKTTRNYGGTPAFSAASADSGRPPTYSDDLEALVFTVSYLRAGTFPWTPGELRRDVLQVAKYKATAGAENLASDACDQLWMGALLTHARHVPWGKQFDLSFCRQIVRKAFENESRGGACGTRCSTGKKGDSRRCRGKMRRREYCFFFSVYGFVSTDFGTRVRTRFMSRNGSHPAHHSTPVGVRACVRYCFGVVFPRACARFPGDGSTALD
jgi:hypothetical protein